MSDRFDEMARETLAKIYQETSKVNALKEDAVAKSVIASAMRSTWNEAVESAARVVERTAVNPWVAVRELKSTGPATRKGDA